MKTDDRIAELRKRWPLYVKQRIADGLPETHGVLEQARKARRARRDVTPMVLYRNSGENNDLYFHAMVEMGYILDGPNGKPYVVCPICDTRLA